MIIPIISFIFFVLLFLLFFPLKLNFNFHINFVDKIGFYSIKLYKFIIVCGKTELKGDKLHILNLKSIKLKSSNFGKKFTLEVLSVLQDIDINLLFACGKQNDAFSVALMYGILSNLLNPIFCILDTKKKRFYGKLDIIPTTKSNEFMFTAFGNIKFNLAQISVAFLLAILKKEKAYGR